MRVLLSMLIIGLTVVYPFIVYFGMQHFSPAWIAGVLMVVALGRFLSSRQRWWLAIAAGTLVLFCWNLQTHTALPVKLYPVLVNGVLLCVFVYSLYYPPSMIERFARIQEPELPLSGVVYTRKVTKIWAIFFLFNGGMALITALFASDKVWAFYNGFFAYVLIGSLMAIEWLIRQHVKKQN